MKKYSIHTLLVCLALVLMTACEQTSIAKQEEIRNVETLQALTPTITPSPTATSTPKPTHTSVPTTGPSPTALPPTATAVPSPTLPPPTATPNPALVDFSICNQVAGDADSGRFSAKVTAITTTLQANFERVVITLDVPADSAAPHAIARCVKRASDGAYAVQLDLDAWLHDSNFDSSIVSSTQTLSATKVLSTYRYEVDPDSTTGGSLIFDLKELHPVRFKLQEKPYRLELDVATSAAIGAASDMLNTQTSDTANPDAPLYYIQNGDIWSYTQGKASNLTNSPETELALAPRAAGGRIAFCRSMSLPGDAIDVSSLWVMELDGKNPQELAAPGRSCADPVMSPDGTKIAFSVDEDAVSTAPARLSIWVLNLTDSQGPQRIGFDDEWSRFGPQWLDNQRLVYTAHAEDGRGTLFLRDQNGEELDIGAELLSNNDQNQPAARYRGFGRPLVSPDGALIAAEALRADQSGADLVLLDKQGQEKKSQSAPGYWTRPLAFGSDGTLYYLTTACESDAVQGYILAARPSSGADTTIASGYSLGSFGGFVALEKGLAYLTHTATGATTITAAEQSAGPGGLWFWDLAGGRTRLLDVPDSISAFGQ